MATIKHITLRFTKTTLLRMALSPTWAEKAMRIPVGPVLVFDGTREIGRLAATDIAVQVRPDGSTFRCVFDLPFSGDHEALVIYENSEVDAGRVADVELSDGTKFEARVRTADWSV